MGRRKPATWNSGIRSFLASYARLLRLATRASWLSTARRSGVRRKRALGPFGELTVKQARLLGQGWLAEVRRGGDPGLEKAEVRKASTVKELCGWFMDEPDFRAHLVSKAPARRRLPMHGRLLHESRTAFSLPAAVSGLSRRFR